MRHSSSLEQQQKDLSKQQSLNSHEKIKKKTQVDSGSKDARKTLLEDFDCASPLCSGPSRVDM